LLVALVAGLVWGCGDAAPTEPGGARGGPVAIDAGAADFQGLEHSVSGSGHIWASEPGDEMRPVLRRFVVNAQLHADGTASGHYNFVGASGLHIEGVVTCVNVVGNRAFIGGTFRNAQPPPPFTAVGVAIEVVDGGRGPGAVDQVGPLGLFAAELGATEADVQAYCDDAIVGPVTTIDLGSITVR
jgi:hypothetical protein